MERFVYLFCSLILGMMGLALPYFVVYANLSLRGGFWLGFILFMVSLFFMLFFLVFSALLMEGAFPGIGSKANNFKNKVNNFGYNAGDWFISMLFHLGFAGEFSRWKTQPDHRAGILSGFWHGAVLPLSLGLSGISDRIRPYESANHRFRYITGFVAGTFVAYLIVFIPGTLTFRSSWLAAYLPTMVVLSFLAPLISMWRKSRHSPPQSIPVTILPFAAIFAGLGLASANTNYLSAVILVLSLFTGQAVWWLLLSGTVSLFRTRFNARALHGINRISGVVITGFGVLALVTFLASSIQPAYTFAK